MISCERREASRFLYYWDFSAIKEIYFDGAMGDPQPFKPDKLFLRNLPPRRMEIVFELAACRIPKNSAFATNPIKISFFPRSLIPIVSELIHRISRRIGIRFDLAASRNPSRTVSATVRLRFKDFSKNEFLLVLSQPMDFSRMDRRFGLSTLENLQ